MSEAENVVDFRERRARPPEEELYLPSDKRQLTKIALDLIDTCRVSVGVRAAWARQLNAIVETGNIPQGQLSRALINMLYSHLDRLASHLYSPVELRFALEFDNEYPKEYLQRARAVSRLLTRSFARDNTDMEFGQGVFEALKYGSCILKQWPEQETPDQAPVYRKSLIMPWQFGVYREDLNELARQPAMCETSLISMPEVWRRICHLPDRNELFRRIKSNMKRGQSADEPSSFFHQVVSTAALNTGNPPGAGGLVQLGNGANYPLMGPDIAAEMVRFHELWVWDRQDYTTVQLIDPDILIAPIYKKSNLLISGESHSGVHPYTKIQANVQQGYFWGRSEITDLIELQIALATTGADTLRMYGLQVEKVLGFSGFDGLTDERYDQARNSGFFSMPMSAQVTDLTPKFPPEAIPLLKLWMEVMNTIGGFDNVLSGRGETGVRAGVHAETLKEAASPRLRDRSLLIERQCAEAGDLRLTLMEAKDARTYWTDPEKREETAFQLHDIPEDRQVTVDSHSGSPIFRSLHDQQIAFYLKAGVIDAHAAIEFSTLPQKDLLQSRLRDKEKQQQALLQQLAQKDPQALEKILSHQGGHHR